MIILRWSQLPEADVASYNVYRSIIGFCAPLVPLATINGKTLELKLNGGPLLTVTFDGVTSIIDQVNGIIKGNGGEAFPTSDTLSWCLRSDLRCGPDGSVEIVGGTALADFLLTARVITEKSECIKMENVLAPADPLCPVEYIDPDGVFGDYYALTTISSLNQESLKTELQQPIEASGALCIIEGVVVNLQGARVPDIEVSAEIQIPPEATTQVNTITKDAITVLTGPSGRFRLALLQGALVEFKIPELNFSRMITVPNLSFVFINDLIEDLDYRYQLFNPLSPIGNSGQTRVITTGGDDT